MRTMRTTKKQLFALCAMTLLVVVSLTNPAIAAMSAEEFIDICETGTPKEVEAAIAAGADVNAQDNDGWTALMVAAHNENSKAVSLLLKAGANLHAKDNNGRTALMFAALGKNAEAMSLLLKAGAEVNTKDNRGETALMDAASFGRAETVLLLLKVGASAKATNNKGKKAIDDMKAPDEGSTAEYIQAYEALKAASK